MLRCFLVRHHGGVKKQHTNKFINVHASMYRFLHNTEKEYLEVLDHTLERVSSVLDPIMDEMTTTLQDEEEYEVESSGDGVMNIKCGSQGTFVVSRQTPARQLWLSSPVSGPWHYQYCPDNNEIVWKCTKQSLSFYNRLSKELSHVLKREIHF